MADPKRSIAFVIAASKQGTFIINRLGCNITARRRTASASSCWRAGHSQRTTSNSSPAFYALAGNIAINNCFNARAINAAVSSTCGTMRIPSLDYRKPASFGSLELKRLAIVDRPQTDGCHLHAGLAPPTHQTSTWNSFHWLHWLPSSTPTRKSSGTALSPSAHQH